MKLHSIILNASAQLMILVFFLHILECNESVSIGLVRDTVIKLYNYDDGQQKSSKIIMKKEQFQQQTISMPISKMRETHVEKNEKRVCNK